MVAACGISCCGFSSSWFGVELRVMRPGCRMLVYTGCIKIGPPSPQKNPGGVTGDFFRGTPDRTMCPEVDTASESEYQGFLLR